MLPILPVIALLKKLAASALTSSIKNVVVDRIEQRRQARNKDESMDGDESEENPALDRK